MFANDKLEIIAIMLVNTEVQHMVFVIENSMRPMKSL